MVVNLPKRVTICGLSYRVVVVRGKGPKDWNRRYEGMCDPGAGVIYISSRLLRNPSRLLDTLIHEICHGLAEGTGLRRWLAKLVPGKPSARRRRLIGELEEDVVRILTPAIITAFQSAGMLWKP